MPPFPFNAPTLLNSKKDTLYSHLHKNATKKRATPSNPHPLAFTTSPSLVKTRLGLAAAVDPVPVAVLTIVTIPPVKSASMVKVEVAAALPTELNVVVAFEVEFENKYGGRVNETEVSVTAAPEVVLDAAESAIVLEGALRSSRVNVELEVAAAAAADEE